jgi:voltage-gated sodium channel
MAVIEVAYLGDSMRHLPSTDDREDHRSRSALVRRCAALADSTAFNLAIFAVILANAVVLGIETYDDSITVLHVLDRLFLGVFVVELSIRLIAHGSNPLRFFRSGWNVFDFLVIAAAFTPGLRENATLLRLVRLARIVRVVRLLPDLRVIVTAVARALPGVASLAIMTLLLIYMYGMVGWVIFGHEIPGYNNAGEAMLTMFVLLSLENLPTYIDEGRAVSEWAIPFYVSYVLLASFLVFNFFIGVIVNSMEQAREIEAERDAQELAEHGDAPAEPSPHERIAALRSILDELERDLRPSATSR